MGVITDHTRDSVNALSIGVQPGTGLQAAEQAANTAVCQKWATAGRSIYFPPGEYEFSGKITWPNTASDVKVWGDNASLYQKADPGRMLEFTEITNVEVCGLHIYGSYWTHGDRSKDASTVTMIYCTRCQDVKIHHNLLEGNSGHAINLLGGRNLSITDNDFKEGVWDTGGGQPSSADIRIERDDTIRADSIIISRNRCNTNTLIGIMSLRPAKKITCTDNQVITRDATGLDITTYGSGDVRKEGIQLQYHTDNSQGGTQADDSLYEMIISGNHVQGVRYAGISCQANDATSQNFDGIRGQINGNLLRYCALEEDGNATTTLQGGISVNIYRDLVIQGNVLKNIRNVPAPNAGSAAIHVESMTGTVSSGGAPVSCVIDGNIITDCDCRGIRGASPGDLLITNNVLTEVNVQQIQIYNKSGSPVPRAGKLTVSGNRCVSSLPISSTQVILEGPSREMTVTDNHFEFTGAYSGGRYAMQIAGENYVITGNRFLGGGANSRGIGFNVQTNQRYNQILVANNHFSGHVYGMRYTSGADPTRGPLVYTNCTFENNTNNVDPTHEFWTGYWIGPNLVVWGTDIPTSSNWESGDMLFHAKATTGEPMGWICTVSGQGPGATWIPYANIP